MKRCPECRRDYYDDTLLYCLDDGNALLEGPAVSVPPAVAGWALSSDEGPETAILHSTSAPGEAPTRAQIHTTEQTAVLARGAEAEPRESLGGLSERPSLSAHRAAEPKSQRNKLLAVCGIGLLLLVGGFFGYRYFSAANSNQINSIAVMPFENRNSDADTDYLSDGLAESVIFRLTQIPDLKVSPTSSVMRYKGASTDVAKIANELGVDAVMTGRLTKRGDNLNITVELVDARTNKSLWGEQYERKLSELLTTQREIVTEIVSKLQLKLSGAGEQKLTKNYTANSEAYQLYLKGRFFWNKRTYEDLVKAIEQFKSAIEQDKNFALAYTGLADCYSVLPYYRGSRSSEVIQQAKEFALRAVELDDQIAEAHTALAFVSEKMWEWDKAEEHYKRAIEINPKYSTAQLRYSRFEIRIRKRQTEALNRMKLAVELEPSSLTANDNLSQIYLIQNEADLAVQQAERTIELDPKYSFGWVDLTFAQIKKGLSAEALISAEKLVEVSNRSTRSLTCLGFANAVSGKRDKAMAITKELEEMYRNGQSDATEVAGVYAGLGDKEQTFAWLDKAFADRSSLLVDIRAEFPFTSFHNDPRFKDLLKRMNLPE